jgi:hypothetical protein
MSPFAKTNYSNSIAYSHSSTTKTIEEIFGLSPLLGHAADSGTVDLADFFKSTIGTPTSTSTPLPTPTPIPGDANRDGKVDNSDYSIWLSNSLSADFNGDGKVDGIDYVIWLNNYGKGISLPTLTPTPTATATGNVQPIGVSGNWNMVLDDEFNTTTLNKSIWTPMWFYSSSGIGGEMNNTCTDSALVTLPGDGYLHLGIKTTPSGSSCTTQFSGSMAESNPQDGSGHKGFQYAGGYVEWRAYVAANSSGKAANWPALWSNGQHWPTDGENDTMEALGGDGICYHFHSDTTAAGGCPSGNYTGWHTFGSDWEIPTGGTPTVTYYYDGINVGSLTSGITSVPQYLIMNMGYDSSYPLIPSEMLVDYVRVWQK